MTYLDVIKASAPPERNGSFVSHTVGTNEEVDILSSESGELHHEEPISCARRTGRTVRRAFFPDDG